MISCVTIISWVSVVSLRRRLAHNDHLHTKNSQILQAYIFIHIVATSAKVVPQTERFLFMILNIDL